MTTAFIADDIAQDEGCKLRAYQDTLGIWTIGVGHAHVQPGLVWTKAQAMAQLDKDVAAAAKGLDKQLAWWRTLNDARQDVLLNMTFNMGIGSVLGFKNTLNQIRLGHWSEAAAGMLSSKWAQQVGSRSRRLAQQMLTGKRIPAATYKG